MVRQNVRKTAFKKRTGWKSSRGTMVRDARSHNPYPFTKSLELKYLDTALSGSTDSTGTVQCLNLMAPGTTGAGDRIGKQIDIKSVQLKFDVNLGVISTAGNAISEAVELYLVWDKQPNGALPAIADYLQNADIRSFHNVGTEDRFQTLWHRTLRPGNMIGVNDALLAAAGGPNGPVTVPVKVFKKINKAVKYSGTAGTIADVSTGALLLISLGDNARNTSAAQALFGRARIRYLDA